MTRPILPPLAHLKALRAGKHASAAQWWEGTLQEAGGRKEPAAVTQEQRDFALPLRVGIQRRPGKLSREAARMIHNGNSGSKRFGICPRVSGFFGLRGWTYFLAGGQEIASALTYRKGLWMVLCCLSFRLLLGETNAPFVNI